MTVCLWRVTRLIVVRNRFGNLLRETQDSLKALGIHYQSEEWVRDKCFLQFCTVCCLFRLETLEREWNACSVELPHSRFDIFARCATYFYETGYGGVCEEIDDFGF